MLLFSGRWLFSLIKSQTSTWQFKNKYEYIISDKCRDVEEC